MRIFKARFFAKWARKERLSDNLLWRAVCEMEQGLVDADLGGHVYKKRIALQGRGKRGGARSIIAYQVAEKAFFIFGYSKNEKVSMSAEEAKVEMSIDEAPAAKKVAAAPVEKKVEM
nr:type II toxin-antitoxin system RelE/ParE family toxin [Gammaproteobacteria bacterium]